MVNNPSTIKVDQLSPKGDEHSVGPQRDTKLQDPTRRAILQALTTTAVGAAILSPRGASASEGVEDAERAREAFVDEAERRREEILTNPEKAVEYLETHEGVYWLITLNFVDLIMGLAGENLVVQGIQKGARTLGKRGESVAKKLEPFKGKSTVSALSIAIATGLAGKKGEYPFFLDRLIGPFDESADTGFNAHFPHPNLYIAALLNVYMLSGGLGHEMEEEAHHVIKETGIGVGLIASLTAMADGVEYAEGALFETFRQEEEAEARAAHTISQGMVENATRLAPEKISEHVQEQTKILSEVIGPAPLMAAMMQVPLFAFGNADLTRIRLEAALPVCRRLFSVFEGYTVEEIERMLQDVDLLKNPALQAVLVKFCADQKDKTVFCTDELLEKVGENYFAEMGLSLMSSTMDVTQGLADLAPAVVGSYQSFGFDQMTNTASVNYALSFVNGLAETRLVAQRMGVPVDALLNKESLTRAVKFFFASLYNLASGMVGLDVDGGAKFKWVTGVLNNFSNILQAMGGGGLNGVCGAFGVKEDMVLVQAALSQLETMRKEQFEAIGSAVVEERKSTLEEDERGAFMRLAETIKSKETEGITSAIHEFQGALRKNMSQDSDGRRRSLVERLGHAAHLLEHNPRVLDLLNFDYWEKLCGPTMAETGFVVTAQGLSLKGLEKIITRYLYPLVTALGETVDHLVPGELEVVLSPDKTVQRSLGELSKVSVSSSVHSGVSMVADNWADQLLHASQLAETIFMPDLLEEFQMDTEEIKIPANMNVLEKWTALSAQMDGALQQRGASKDERRKLAGRLFDKFLLIKHVSIWFAIYGGGESTIGNSPHFRAFVEDIKKLITLGKSFTDIIKHFQDHSERYVRTLAMAYLAGPMLEMSTCDNIFLPDDLKATA